LFAGRGLRFVANFATPAGCICATVVPDAMRMIAVMCVEIYDWPHREREARCHEKDRFDGGCLAERTEAELPGLGAGRFMRDHDVSPGLDDCFAHD
jgi:hypothetical protein